MDQTTVGISDISLYLPKNRILLNTILAKRTKENPEIQTRLSRAIQSTDQVSIRFPSLWEDAAVLAGNSVLRLMNQQNGDLGILRYFVVGTETTVDLSKSMSAYVQGMLGKSPYPIPSKISSFQVQHACAGATLGMLSVAGLLAAAGKTGETGLVIASDIARYDAPSTAEITQGAGSAAMLVEVNPKLVSFNLETQGFSSNDVDDFFRPLGSTTAKVKGRYSVQCYNEALDEAFGDFCERSNRSPKEVLENTDYFVFHVPFAKMANTAVRRLLSNHLGIFAQEAEDFLSPRGFFEALQVTGDVGNIYTGAIYLNLMATLYQQYQIHGDSIIGKKILFSSYGSGNTMVVFDGEVMPNAPEIIKQWDFGAYISNYQESNFDEYLSWIDRSYTFETFENQKDTILTSAEPGFFYLESIREDGYRNYQYKNTST
jgi:hydroxymethylglutaryl-CoA synthase